MDFLTVYFYSFLSADFKVKAKDYMYDVLLDGKFEHEKNWKSQNLPPYKKPTPSGRVNYQMAVFGFFDKLLENYGNKPYHHIVALILNFYPLINEEHRILYKYMKRIKMSNERERNLYIFMRRLIEHALSAGEENFGKYIDKGYFKSINNRMEFFGAKDSTGTLEFFLLRFHRIFTSAIYHGTPIKTNEPFDGVVYDWEMNDLYTPSFEDYSAEEIEAIKIKKYRKNEGLITTFEVDPAEWEKMKKASAVNIEDYPHRKLLVPIAHFNEQCSH
jgi:hypothetical protein